MTAATFAVFRPRVWESGRRAAIDVLPIGLESLGKGTRRLVDEVAAAAGLAGIIDTWTITPFRSSYYSTDLSADDWHVRFPTVYDVEVWGNLGVRRESGRQAPTSVAAVDTSATTGHWAVIDDAAWPPIVIVDAEENALKSIEREVHTLKRRSTRITWYSLSARVSQSRIEMLDQQLPRDQDELTQTLVRLRAAGASVHWSTTSALLSEEGEPAGESAKQEGHVRETK
jgi:hypothetical protein